MKLPARTWQRLTLAATAAVVAVFLLSWVAGRWLPTGWQELVDTRLGYLAPVSYCVIAIGMAAGGMIGGRPFVPLALALTLLIWLGTVIVLASLSLSLATPGGPHPLPQILRTNLANLVMTFVVAGLAAHAGGRWRERRAVRESAA